jgi:hypothetical protein
MDPLRVVEERLGALEICPTYILVHTFVAVTSDDNFKNVAAFMYGNDVLIEIAVKCSNASSSLKCNFVVETVHKWRYIWDRRPYKCHRAEHYNIRLKCIVWINGRTINQQDMWEWGKLRKCSLDYRKLNAHY